MEPLQLQRPNVQRSRDLRMVLTNFISVHKNGSKKSVKDMSSKNLFQSFKPQSTFIFEHMYHLRKNTVAIRRSPRNVLSLDNSTNLSNKVITGYSITLPQIFVAELD